MAIILRKVNGTLVALCAAKTKVKNGDVYLNDDTHHALTEKFARDFTEMGFLRKGLQLFDKGDEKLALIEEREEE